MKDFTLCIPTKIVFGKNKISEIGKYCAEYGNKALFVYGQGSIKSNGIYDIVVNSLKGKGIEFIEYPGVRPNPLVSHAKKGIEVARKEKVGFILAVGGGSVIDEAKAIAAGFFYEGDVWDFYKNTAKIKAALPLLTVLTLPATGSEMNGGTVLSDENTKKKFGFINKHLCPKVSILDPSVTLSIPLEYTAYSVVDACIHLLEGYFTHDDTWSPIQERYAEGLVRTIIECMAKIMENPKNYEARATFMWAATLAWNGIGSAGLGGISSPNHLFAHILGGHYDIAHGAALSIIVPGWMKYKYREKTHRFAMFAENVFGIKNGDENKKALAGIDAFEKWFIQIGSPVSFRDANLSIDELKLDELADDVLELADIWDIKEYTRESIIDILKLCL
ncbi:MAG: NADH-dependent butanol dehydrogenase A [Actinobacteria bacterium ADurb.Bin346]|nr:MAG: NADH-dependent butanol dehydrogenase A [Actinobacteria bacterium ADurb.Bin346]